MYDMCMVYGITEENIPTGNFLLNVDFYMFKYMVHEVRSKLLKCMLKLTLF